MSQLGEFVLNHWDLFLALLIILAMLIGQPLTRRLRGYHDVDPQEAVGLMNRKDAVLVDVREDKEHREGHIAGSVHVPLSGFSRELNRLEAFQRKPVIVGCRSGHRSGKAAGMLRKQGFEEVYNLKGGLLAWENAGLPLSTGKTKKKRKADKK